MLAIYAGTFDPITNGHTDILRRASRLFAGVILGIAVNEAKRPFFGIEARRQFAEMVVREARFDNVSVVPFDTSLMSFVKTQNAQAIVRGIRSTTDFEYEFAMASVHRTLYPNIETVFLTPASDHTIISSSMVKELAKFNEDVSKFVHPLIADTLAMAIQGESLVETQARHERELAATLDRTWEQRNR